jgi:omega-6 fatty acid desaturase (delta-12 desaturase)
MTVRVFVIFHDCAHGSFFDARWANDLVGRICGIICYTPYHAWRHSHGLHHATSGDLDQRGSGDICTLTRAEFESLPVWRQWAYRVFRNPLVIIGVAPAILFVVLQRFPFMISAYKQRERKSVIVTDAVLLLVNGAVMLAVGWQDYVLVQLPVVLISSSIGGWLFYVQHQYRTAYWKRHSDWNFVSAAVSGSSFYKLPTILKWFTGNIGFHHIHHLNPRIPNYFLEHCHNSCFAGDDSLKVLTLRSSIACLRVRLWDENRLEMVGFDGK